MPGKMQRLAQQRFAVPMIVTVMDRRSQTKTVRNAIVVVQHFCNFQSRHTHQDTWVEKVPLVLGHRHEHEQEGS